MPKILTRFKQNNFQTLQIAHRDLKKELGLKDPKIFCKFAPYAGTPCFVCYFNSKWQLQLCKLAGFSSFSLTDSFYSWPAILAHYIDHGPNHEGEASGSSASSMDEAKLSTKAPLCLRGQDWYKDKPHQSFNLNEFPTNFSWQASENLHSLFAASA